MCKVAKVRYVPMSKLKYVRRGKTDVTFLVGSIRNLLRCFVVDRSDVYITAHDKCHFLTLRRNGNVSCAVRSDLADDVFVYLIRQDSDIYFCGCPPGTSV